MRFLKNQNINRFTINDQTLMTNQFGRAVMGLTGGLRLPQGTTSERPNPSQGRWPGVTSTQTNLQYADGTIRYNTTIDPLTLKAIGLECLIEGVWTVVRAPGASTIYKQTLGPGDAVTTAFGPLARNPVADDNIIVLVENVMQISVTNYTINYNYLGSGNQYIIFESPPPIGKYITIYFGFVN
jgi:hypothetical protein